MNIIVARAIASGFGSGLGTIAPGTLGSIGCVLLCAALEQLGLPHLGTIITVAALSIILGFPAISRVLRSVEETDPGFVVIDEWAGMAIALLPTAPLIASPTPFLSPEFLIAFALFRLFDVLKPGPIGWAERLPDAAGVMMDDIIAGVLAALSLLGLKYLLVI